MNNFPTIAIVLLSLLACSCTSADRQQAHSIDADLIITNTTAITMTGDGTRSNVDIFINGETITATVDTGTFSGPADALTIDGTGLFIIPGLADMHVHIRHKDMLPVLAANGVTLVREMWGTEEILNLRETALTENWFAPSILVGSRGVDGSPPTFPGGLSVVSPEVADSVVESLLADGYDFIKIYDRLSVESFDAIAKACQSRSVRFAGHPPFGVPFDRVLESGIASIEHLQGYVFANARDEIGISNDLIDPMQDFPKLIQAISTAQQQGLAISSVFDANKRARVAERTAKNGVWNTPTLITLLKANTPSDERDIEFARDELAYVHPDLVNQWRPENNFRFQFLSDDMIRGLRSLRGESLRMTKSLQDAGAGLLLGTDTPEAFVIPGVSAHEELEQFVEAGLTPLQALATATSNVGQFLGEPGSLGVIRDGARADLVLLAEDPTTEIRNTRNILGVVLRGTYFDRSSIDEILDRTSGGFETGR